MSPPVSKAHFSPRSQRLPPFPKILPFLSSALRGELPLKLFLEQDPGRRWPRAFFAGPRPSAPLPIIRTLEKSFLSGFWPSQAPATHPGLTLGPILLRREIFKNKNTFFFYSFILKGCEKEREKDSELPLVINELNVP